MTYPVLTGKADHARLLILNKIYNPTSYKFIKMVGLKRNLTILEVGCGSGDMACWLAKSVGPTGKVFAIDQDEKQINLATNKALAENISNIEFVCTPLEKFSPEFYDTFDLVYIRWTLMFFQDPKLGLQIMKNFLKKGGILICEDVSSISNGIFTCPKSDVGSRWTDIITKNFRALNFHFDLAGSLFSMLTELGFKSINAQLHQPILKSKKEKSVFRLGILSTRDSILKNNAASSSDLEKLIQDVKGFEGCNRSIVGYIRNLLISGVK